MFKTRALRFFCSAWSVLVVLALSPRLRGQNYDQQAVEFLKLISIVHFGQAERTDEAHRMARQFLELAEQQQNPREIGRWTSFLGATYFAMGNYTEAERCYTKALPIEERALAWIPMPPFGANKLIV